MATKFNVAPALSVPFQTADATPVVAAYFNAHPYPLCAFFFEVKVIAVYADGSLGANYWLQAAFRTDADGVVTQIGSTAAVVTAEEDTGGMAVTVQPGTNTGVDDTQIQVSVTGVAATDIDWVLDNTIRHAPFSK